MMDGRLIHLQLALELAKTQTKKLLIKRCRAVGDS